MDIFEFLLQVLLFVTHLSDQHFVFISLALQLFQLFFEGSVVVVEVFVHFLVFVEFSLILADSVLQCDFTFVGFVPVVLQFLLHVADFALFGGQLVFQVFLGFQQAIIVIFQTLDR